MLRAVLFLAALLAPACAETRLVFGDYRVLYDAQKQGYRANSAGAALLDGQLDLVFTGALNDDEAGTLPFLARSRDLGATWTAPQRFGAEIIGKLIRSPREEFLALTLFGPTRRQTLLSIGYHVRRGTRKESYREDVRWRPGALLIGRKAKGESAFTYQDYASGTFLGEQFGAPGLQTAGGRLVATLWGAARQGENWQCGVLLSDDDGLTWRYRQVGYAAEPAIRDDPQMPAGYNEQTLFETRGGLLVSVIRGREKLGRVPESPKDTWFFRAVSRDRGETWSRPEPSNLAGTGAPAAGLALPDGSLLMAARVPYSRTLYRLPEKDLFGLHLVRSFDGGRTWRTVKIVQRDPDGNPFDNYYNAMNGQFLSLGGGRWMYLFGEFSVKRDQHRVLMLRFSVQ